MNLDGLILESKYAEYQFCLKGPTETTWQDGFPRQQPKHIVLEFDSYTCVVEDEARNKEWTDEDKEYISRTLDRFLNDRAFNEMWVHEKPKPALPWPKFNETHHKQVPVIAAATGTVAEALAYEEYGRDGGPRPEVMERLRELLNNGTAAEAAEEVDEELSAV